MHKRQRKRTAQKENTKPKSAKPASTHQKNKDVRKKQSTPKEAKSQAKGQSSDGSVTSRSSKKWLSKKDKKDTQKNAAKPETTATANKSTPFFKKKRPTQPSNATTTSQKSNQSSTTDRSAKSVSKTTKEKEKPTVPSKIQKEKPKEPSKAETKEKRKKPIKETTSQKSNQSSAADRSAKSVSQKTKDKEKPTVPSKIQKEKSKKLSKSKTKEKRQKPMKVKPKDESSQSVSKSESKRKSQRSVQHKPQSASTSSTSASKKLEKSQKPSDGPSDTAKLAQTKTSPATSQKKDHPEHLRGTTQSKDLPLKKTQKGSSKKRAKIVHSKSPMKSDGKTTPMPTDAKSKKAAPKTTDSQKPPTKSTKPKQSKPTGQDAAATMGSLQQTTVAPSTKSKKKRHRKDKSKSVTVSKQTPVSETPTTVRSGKKTMLSDMLPLIDGLAAVTKEEKSHRRDAIEWLQETAGKEEPVQVEEVVEHIEAACLNVRIDKKLAKEMFRDFAKLKIIDAAQANRIYTDQSLWLKSISGPYTTFERITNAVRPLTKYTDEDFATVVKTDWGSDTHEPVEGEAQ